MPSLAMPVPFALWFARLLELRIDVILPPAELEAELNTLYERMLRPGDILHGLATIDIEMPGFLFRYREADGEHYVYVEDTVRGRLAGYTVFNRLIEVNRHIDPYLRAPHSKYGRAYQRRGIAGAIYRWWLNAGRCMISGARQSVGSNALWRSLNKEYELIFVAVREKKLHYLGHRIDEQSVDDLGTRMILLGKEWDLAKFGAATRMALPAV
ncbi:MAG: N-acetyltransferase [Burkholderiaceae bacterium]